MARSRNIKPSIFKNELLGEADPLITILFTGLWCLADRDGRLEDRPKRIKAEIFPYRELPDFNGYLTELERLGFITRYEVGGQKIIQVINFSKHQSPHHTEKAGELPENPIITSDSGLTVNSPLDNGNGTDTNPLIPDSLNLIPDSLIPDSCSLNPETLNGVSDETLVIFQHWQSVMNKPSSRLTPNRKKKIQARLKSFSPDQLMKAIDGCRRSRFHMGDNDNKTEYNDLELICRNDEKTEFFLNITQVDSAKSTELEDWVNA